MSAINGAVLLISILVSPAPVPNAFDELEIVADAEVII